MKLFKNTPKGKRYETIGAIVFFTCCILPFILLAVFNIPEPIAVIVMLIQMGIGAFLILFGGAVSKRMKIDPNYVIPKNFLRVFKGWQLLLMLAAVLFFILVFCIQYVNVSWLNSVLTIAVYVCLIAAAVLGIIRHQKNKKKFISIGGGKMVRKNGIDSLAMCKRCGQIYAPDALYLFEGEKYCAACYAKVLAEKESEGKSKDTLRRVKPIQRYCSGCGRALQKSALHLVNGKFLCEECFQKEFSADL